MSTHESDSDASESLGLELPDVCHTLPCNLIFLLVESISIGFHHEGLQKYTDNLI